MKQRFSLLRNVLLLLLLTPVLPVLWAAKRITQLLYEWAARSLAKQLPSAPKLMGVPLVVMKGDQAEATARVQQILEYIARSPRHLAQVQRNLKVIGVGGPAVKHGAYLKLVHGCNLATNELQGHSLPALAATVVYVAAQARFSRFGMDPSDATKEQRRRILVVCKHASIDFLERAQGKPRAA